MKFLCMGYFMPEKMDAQPKEKIEEIMNECQPHLEHFYESGKVTMDAGLSVETKSLKRKKGKVTVTDGPFAETKELIGSVFMVEAENMDEAIELASLHPTTQLNIGEELGWRIEIRPVHYFKDDPNELS